MSLLSKINPSSIIKKGWPWTEEVDPIIYSKHKNWPKISIVTPSLNQGIFIEETIRSILLQNYPNLEYIIIDGSSSDDSIEIIKKYSNFLTYWISEPDYGQADAINKGILMCTGQIFNWINSDDLLCKNALFLIGSSFIDKPFNLFLGKLITSNGNNNIVCNNFLINDDLLIVLKNLTIRQPSTFYYLTFVKELNGLNVNFHYSFDFEFIFRLLLKYGVKNISSTNEVLSIFRLHANSKTILNGDQFQYEGYLLYHNLCKEYSLLNFKILFEEVISKNHIMNYSYRQIFGEQPIIEKYISSCILSYAEKFYSVNNFKNSYMFAKVLKDCDLDIFEKKIQRKIKRNSKYFSNLIIIKRYILQNLYRVRFKFTHSKVNG